MAAVSISLAHMESPLDAVDAAEVGQTAVGVAVEEAAFHTARCGSLHCSWACSQEVVGTSCVVVGSEGPHSMPRAPPYAALGSLFAACTPVTHPVVVPVSSSLCNQTFRREVCTLHRASGHENSPGLLGYHYEFLTI